MIQHWHVVHSYRSPHCHSHHLYPHEDARPLTVNHLNQLVQKKFGHQAYEAVEGVGENLHWLYKLYAAMPLLMKLQAHTIALDEVAKHTRLYETLAESNRAYQEIVDNLPMLQQLSKLLAGNPITRESVLADLKNFVINNVGDPTDILEMISKYENQ